MVKILGVAYNGLKVTFVALDLERHKAYECLCCTYPTLDITQDLSGSLLFAHSVG